MKDVFGKKYWEEEEVMFYIHFQDGFAVAQIEVTKENKVFLSTESPWKDNSILYDQHLDELNLQKNDFISKSEFMDVWRSDT